VAAAIRTDFAPGAYVRHPERPDWGLGQVQSAVGSRITVTFENAGKVLVNAALVTLETISDAELDAAAAAPKYEAGA
jgi:Protein of unknown function (DUF3553)